MVFNKSIRSVICIFVSTIVISSSAIASGLAFFPFFLPSYLVSSPKSDLFQWVYNRRNLLLHDKEKAKNEIYKAYKQNVNPQWGTLKSPPLSQDWRIGGEDYEGPLKIITPAGEDSPRIERVNQDNFWLLAGQSMLVRHDTIHYQHRELFHRKRQGELDAKYRIYLNTNYKHAETLFADLVRDYLDIEDPRIISLKIVGRDHIGKDSDSIVIYALEYADANRIANEIKDNYPADKFFLNETPAATRKISRGIAVAPELPAKIDGVLVKGQGSYGSVISEIIIEELTKGVANAKELRKNTMAEMGRRWRFANSDK